MSQDDHERWNSRYRAMSPDPQARPSTFLTAWIDELAGAYPGARALDLACGRGRNALALAAAGFEVVGIDISEVALAAAQAIGRARGVEVEWRAADLDRAELPPDGFDLILVSRYLNRARTADLIAALRPGGTLLYEQHARLCPSPNVPIVGPRRPEIRVGPNELLERFGALFVRYYEAGIFPREDGQFEALARLVARRRGAAQA